MARQRRQEQNPLDKNEQERKSLWFINLRLNFPLQKFHLFRHYHRSRVIMSSQGSLRCPGWLAVDWLTEPRDDWDRMDDNPLFPVTNLNNKVGKSTDFRLIWVRWSPSCPPILFHCLLLLRCFFFICPVKTSRSCLFLCVGMPREFIHPTVAP